MARGRPRKTRTEVPVNSEPKRCPRCQQWFPRTLEFWHYNSRTKDLLHGYCRNCANQQSSERYRGKVGLTHLSKPYLPRPTSAQSLSYRKQGVPSNIPAGYRICTHPYCRRVFPDNNQFYPRGDQTGLCYLCELVVATGEDEILTKHDMVPSDQIGQPLDENPLIPAGMTEEQVALLREQIDEVAL